MNLPKVSVVIPAYNEAAYIEKTLQALLQQDFQYPFEVIVVDNASTDATAEIAGGFPGIRVVREERRGVGFARERGRQEVRGEIFASLDADCVPPNDWLKRGVAYFDQSHIVAVSGPYYYYDASLFFRFILTWFQKIFYPIIHILFHNIWHKGAVLFGGNFMARKTALEKIGGFDTSIAFLGEDNDTARRLTKFGMIIFRGNLMIPSSVRRFKHHGFFKTSVLYFLNFFWVTLFRKPFSR